MPFIYVVALVGASAAFCSVSTPAPFPGQFLLKKDFSLTLTSGLQESSPALHLLAPSARSSGALADRYGGRRLGSSSRPACLLSARWRLRLPNRWNGLIAARLFIGSAIGIASLSRRSTFGDRAGEDLWRGLANQVAVTVELASYLTDYAFAHEGGWRWMFGVGVVPAIAFGIGIVLMPSSPRWL
ncbi:MAG: MFS transporter [Xanthobacteraceae bacterium]